MKQIFKFCTHCHTMFKHSEVDRPDCPDCHCKFAEHPLETWELDPFDPKSWPFGAAVVHKSFHLKSTNEEFFILPYDRFYSTFKNIYCAVFTIALLCIYYFKLFKNIRLDFVDILGSLLLFLTALVFLVGTILLFTKRYFSIDNENLYITTTYCFLFKTKQIIPRKQCTATCKVTEKLYMESLNYCITLDSPSIKVTKGIIIEDEPININDSLKTTRMLNIARWLSTYIKYAYDEDFLPQPEIKYGKKLPVLNGEDFPITEEIYRMQANIKEHIEIPPAMIIEEDHSDEERISCPAAPCPMTNADALIRSFASSTPTPTQRPDRSE